MAETPNDHLGAYLEGRLSRRDFVVRTLALGVSVGAAADLLAAADAAAGASKLHGHIQIFVGLGTGNAPAQIPVQEALAKAFTKQHPGVKIEFIRAPTDARTKLITLAAGGRPPDIVMPVGTYGISLLVDQNFWLDLRNYFKRDGIKLTRFEPQVTQAVRVPNYYGSHSKAAIGVPVGLHDHALAYNAELFAQASVAPPPESWKDASWTYQGKFLDTAKALTVDKNGQHPDERGFDANNIVRFGLGHFFRESIWLAFGGRYYDQATRKVQFDTPGSIAGIQFASDLVNKYHVQPSQTQIGALGAGAPAGQEEEFAWKAGKLAMIDMCSCDIKGGFGLDVPFRWKAGSMPAGPARRFGFLNLDLGSIVRASKNHDVAWEVLKYFGIAPVPERKLSYGSYGAFPPLRANFDAFPKGIRHDLPSVDPSVWQNGFPYSSTDNESWYPAFTQVNDLVGPAFDKIMAGSPAAPIMKQLQVDAQAQVDNWFKTHKLPH